jgi:hypothetical protein
VPRSFRGEESSGYPEGGLTFGYKPRSMLAEYRGLVIVFGILFLALAAYFVKSLRAARHPPPPTQSVYIEVVPEKAPPVQAQSDVP